MKKIAVIAICNFIDTPTGGEVTFLNSILKAHDNKDIQISLIGMTNDQKEKSGEWFKKSIGSKIYKFLPVFKEIQSKEETKIPYRLRLVAGLRRYRNIISNEKYDYIYIHCPEIILGLGNNIINKSKLIYHVHGEPSSTIKVSRFKLLQGINVISNIYMKIIDKCIEKSSRVIWVSTRGMHDYSKVSRVQHIEKKSVVTANPYDSELFVFDENKVNKTDNIECVFAGRLSKGKNVELAIRAIKKLDNPKIKFTICGDGEERENLEKLASQLDIKENVRFLGNVSREKLPGILQKSDIFLLPSLNEGSPVCVPEALAMGNIVISTDVGDVNEIIFNNYNGIISKDFHISSFANNINNIVKNRDLMVKGNSIKSSLNRSSKNVAIYIFDYIVNI